jgi:hypothetical protein
MRSLFFPTLIVDNFFEEPDKVRNFALNLEYKKDTDNRWPGKKSELLHNVEPLFFDLVMCKIINLFISNSTDINYNSFMTFQLVDDTYDSGWVHEDSGSSVLTSIIYLTPGQISGTSLYKKNDTIKYRDSTFVKEKREVFALQQSNEKTKNLHNEQYTESVNIKGQYNRMIIFESHNYHAAHKFIGDTLDTSRLTLVSFININTSVINLPVVRSISKSGGL